MPRPEKVQAVADIKERIEAAQAVFLAEYAGLSVKEQQQLRRGLRDARSEFKVVKMTLARRAVEELGYDDLTALLSGPTGLAFSAEDAAATAKVLRDFAGEHARLVIKGALYGGEVLPPERVSELASLEPRDVLLSQIAGVFKAPLQQMAGLMAALPRNLASMMLQLVERKGPAEAPPEEMAPAQPEASEAEEPPAEPEASGAQAAAEDQTQDAPALEATAEPASEADGDEPAPKAEEED